MREIVLLGAGASVDAGVPDTYDMTEKILAAFEQDPGLRSETRVLHFVLGGLLFRMGTQGTNPLNAGVNVEELFSAVQMLAERNTLEAAPFVGSWHTMVEELDQVSAPSYAYGRLGEAIFKSIRGQILDAFAASPPSYEVHKIDDTLKRAIDKTIAAALKGRQPSFTSSESLARAIDSYIEKVAKSWSDKLKRSNHLSLSVGHDLRTALKEVEDRPGGGRIFATTCEMMIRTLTRIVWINDESEVGYLVPLVQRADKGRAVTIVTLNYDNTIELAAQAIGIECNTGIDDWSRTGRLPPVNQGVRLLKLHGSIDWRLVEPSRTSGGLPQTGIARVENPERNEYYMPAVVFGQRGKLTADGPYLALLAAFEDELRSSDQLTAIGYSFRDDHINTYIARWLNEAPERHMVVVDPCFCEFRADFARELLVLKEKPPSRITVHAAKAREAIAMLYGDGGSAKLAREDLGEPAASS